MPIKTEEDEMAAVPAQTQAMFNAWNQKINDALTREKTYRKNGQKVVDLYEAKTPDSTPFAIVYSNTETLQPALYNAKPIPIVSRRYKDEDPIGKIASEVSTRTLKYLIDDESPNYDSFDELIQTAVLDGLLTNRGLTRYKYSPPGGPFPERVCGESVRWDKFLHGYARTWKKVPWIAFEWDMSLEEVKANFPDAQLAERNLLSEPDEPDETESREQRTGVTVYKVWEIWDKASRQVIFISALSPRQPLKVVEDPLGLTNFFPVPKPLNFMRKVSTLLPTPLYEHYRSQAQELNEITRRLKAIIKAIKFRGAYNSAIEGIEKMLKADDNELVPVENLESMPDGQGGIDKILWTVPINDLATTAQSLYQQRESVKQVIYEITGISDILRGASQASETATAQQIKNQWGSLRLKKMQKEVQRYVRDSLAIILEIAAGKFEVQTFQQMTGLPYPTEAQKQQVQQQMQAAEMQAAQQAMMTGQQPQPPQVPPEIQKMLQEPTWEDVIGLLRNNVLLHYKTDIETNSTIDAEAAQDKQDISELLNALSQFLNGLAPLVEKGFMPFDIAKNMMLSISRRYNFGSQLEESLQQMAAPQPQGPDPADQAKLQQTQAEAQAAAVKAQTDMQLSQMEFENKKQLMALQLQVEQAQLEIKRQELALQAQQLQMKMTQAQQQHQMKMQQMAMQAQAQQQAHEAAEKETEKEPA